MSTIGQNCCGEAEYVFNKSIELTGARYRKEHGGMSISCAHAIVVAQNHEAITKAVTAVYSENDDLQIQARRAMKIFGVLAEFCYKISLICKSQQKVDHNIDTFADLVCDFAIAFREHLPERNVYLKLHFLECILVAYAREHGFIGLGSEEGFESAHNRLRWIKLMLSAMPFAKDRCEKMGQRFYMSLHPEFEVTWRKLNPPTKTRGPYAKKDINEKRKGKHVERLEKTLVSQAGYAKLASGNYIVDTWQELYDFVAFKTATKRMKSYFDGDDNNSLTANTDRQTLINYAA